MISNGSSVLVGRSLLQHLYIRYGLLLTYDDQVELSRIIQLSVDADDLVAVWRVSGGLFDTTSNTVGGIVVVPVGKRWRVYAMSQIQQAGFAVTGHMEIVVAGVTMQLEANAANNFEKPVGAVLDQGDKFQFNQNGGAQAGNGMATFIWYREDDVA